MGRNYLYNLGLGLACNSPLHLALAITPDLQTEDEKRSPNLTPSQGQSSLQRNSNVPPEMPAELNAEERQMMDRLFGITRPTTSSKGNPNIPKPLPTVETPTLTKGLLAWFPEGKDSIISNLLKEHSAQEIKIPVTGIPERNNTSKLTICNSVTFTTIKVQLNNLLKSFLITLKDSKPELYKKISELTKTSLFLSDGFQNIKGQTVTVIKRHLQTPSLNRPFTFSITAQEVVNLLRRKTEKLLTTPA